MAADAQQLSGPGLVPGRFDKGQADAPGLLLLALVGVGVLARDDTGRFVLPPGFAPLLDPDGADTMASILDHHHHLLARWAQLADVVRTGEPAPDSRPARTDRSLRAFICDKCLRNALWWRLKGRDCRPSGLPASQWASRKELRR